MSTRSMIWVLVGVGMALGIVVGAYVVFRARSVSSQERERWAEAEAAGDVDSLESYLDWSFETTESGGVAAWALAHLSDAEAHGADAEARIDRERVRADLASGETLRVCAAARAHPELADVGLATAALTARANAAVDGYVASAAAMGARADAIEMVTLGLRRAALTPCLHAPLLVPTFSIGAESGLGELLGASTMTAREALELDGALHRQQEAFQTSIASALDAASGSALSFASDSALVVTIDAAVLASADPFSVGDGPPFPGIAMNVTLSVRAPSEPARPPVERTAYLVLPPDYGGTITTTLIRHEGWTETSYPWMTIYAGMMSSLVSQLAAFVRGELGLAATP